MSGNALLPMQRRPDCIGFFTPPGEDREATKSQLYCRVGLTGGSAIASGVFNFVIQKAVNGDKCPGNDFLYILGMVSLWFSCAYTCGYAYLWVNEERGSSHQPDPFKRVSKLGLATAVAAAVINIFAMINVTKFCSH